MPGPTQEQTQTPFVITATADATQGPTNTPLPSQSPTSDTAALNKQIKAANVLYYDDPDADLRLVPRVDKAVQAFGFSGGTILNASNRPGTFVTQLQDQRWDLVILSVESRETVNIGDTGFFNGIYEHINRGGALIVETWNLDEDQSSLGGLLLNACDAHVEKDWHRGEDFELGKFVLFKLPNAGNIFEEPRLIEMPLHPTIFWEGDAGDFIRLSPDGSSHLLAGEPSPYEDNYGLLTSCLDGRMVLQTFSTHDYPLYQTVRLYQNMMHYTLSNYFSGMK